MLTTNQVAAKPRSLTMPRKAYCLALLNEARAHLSRHDLVAARACLSIWRCEYNCAPKSTQRRWRCGK